MVAASLAFVYFCQERHRQRVMARADFVGGRVVSVWERVVCGMSVCGRTRVVKVVV